MNEHGSGTAQAPIRAEKQWVEVSPEMTLLIGPGGLGAAPLPREAMAIAFAADGFPTLSFDLAPSRHSLKADPRLILVIERAAFARVGGPALGDGARRFHLPSALRAIVLAILDCGLSGETLKVYRLGKSIELLCETIRLLTNEGLVPVAADGALSLDDARRVIAARRMIDERWTEKLTLDKIARACGLNRAKLTRAFRETFDCTIAEAIAERRLSQACLMLRTTDLPVSSIGYENGYLNNASFARAFARRFGRSPSDFRQAAA
ncbi:MAG: helix-turn-helix domain-containing protein [Alphaproteobacteria bacterium]|nr:helix-turn-helix domain-containing protein [Alphaproteobacteria bacterium]